MHSIVENGRRVFVDAILSMLKDRSDYINNIERTGRGEIPITGISLDVTPWHKEFGLSLRLTEEFPSGECRLNSASWKHFDFTSDSTVKEKTEALKFIEQNYESNGLNGQDSAHLIFVAGAEALLDPQVSELLNKFSIKAPVISNESVGHFFEFIVCDPDETISGNYCEIVIANRITNRLENA